MLFKEEKSHVKAILAFSGQCKELLSKENFIFSGLIKDIITLRGSAAIVSEFFGMLLCLIDLLDKNPLFKFSVRFSLLSFVENLG